MYTCYLTLLYNILKGPESVASVKSTNTCINLVAAWSVNMWGNLTIPIHIPTTPVPNRASETPLLQGKFNNDSTLEIYFNIQSDLIISF